MVRGRRGPLRLRIEAPDRLDLIPEEVDTHRPFLLGRVDVEDSAAQRHLSRHLDDIDPGVADRQEMLHQHVGQMLFAGSQMESEAVVEVAREELHAGGFHRGDDEAWCCRSLRGGFLAELPECCSAVLLNLRMRRQVLERQHIMSGKS